MDAEVPPIVTNETSKEVPVSTVASPPGDETKSQDKDTPIISDADKNSEKPTSLNNEEEITPVDSTDVSSINTDNEKVADTTDPPTLSDKSDKAEEPVADSTETTESVTLEDSPAISEKSTEVGMEEKTTSKEIPEDESTVASSSNDNESDQTGKSLEPEKSKDLEAKDPEESQEADKNKKTEKVTKPSDSSVATIVPEEKEGEPENTEFVQITQDKNDDSNTEAQSAEAEDPFAGDSLATETLENMDNDDIGFSKLSEQADNLQDIVNSKSSDEASKEGEKANEKSTTSEGTNPIVETLDKETTEKSQEKDVEVIENNDSRKEKSNSPSKKDDKDKNDKDKNNSNESDKVNEGQSDVLPGQDDELCIIPDRGIVIPSTTEATTTEDKNKDKETAEEKPEEESSKDTTPNEQQKEKKTSGVSVISAAKSGIPSTSEADKDKEVVNPVAEIIDNVINIDSEKGDDMDIVTIETCKQCKEQKPCTIQVKLGSESANVCSRLCQANFLGLYRKTTDTSSDGTNLKYEKRCAFCLLIVETDDERNLSWETMEFCNEECLGKLQTKYGSYCKNCNGTVQPMSLGKYCVRFGYDVRQFCCSSCLEEFKKGLKVCSYCQKDISSNTDGFLAPVGDRGQFKDFCTHTCMDKYSKMNSTDKPDPEEKSCSVCQEKKIVHCEIQIDGGASQAICSEPCFAAFKFVNKVDPDKCSTCKKFFKILNSKNTVVFYNNDAHTFCSKSCLNIFIISNRKIVPCNWCKVKKYNFDMIKKDLKSGGVVMMCSLNCLTLYQVSINAVSARKINCDLCKEFSQAQYHLTMSDATIRNFCSYNCVMKFQGQYTKSPITIPIGEETSTPPVPTGMPKRTYPGKTTTQSSPLTKKTTTAVSSDSGLTTTTTTTMTGNIQTLQGNKKTMPVISSVSSLATMSTNGLTNSTMSQKPINSTITTSTSIGTQAQVIYKQQLITRPTSPVQVHNKMTQCKPLMHTKGVSVRPHPCTKSTQTDEVQKILVPIPVPIYVPFPVHMFSFPVPVPLPFPIPIPVPIFIPTTRKSTKGIFEDLKKIQEKIPSDPIEAELIMMAERAEMESEKKMITEEPDSDSSCDDNNHETEQTENSINEDDDNSLKRNLDVSLEDLGNDVNQEPAEDLEATLATNTITAPPSAALPPAATEDATAVVAVAEEEETTTTPVSSQESRETLTAVEANNTVDNANLTPDKKDETPAAPQEQQPQQPQRGTSTRGKKRTVSTKPRSTSVKRNRKSNNKDNTKQGLMPPPTQTNQDASNNVLRTIDTIEKPDANMALKYLFGKNAWCQWVVNKNHELEKQNTPTRKVKLFNTDLLQLTADELNYSLCLFVKEVRKPNGTEYAPDTIYYLCLGIQQYLFENGRIDNIFTDSYYEKFTDCLDEIARKFSVLYNDAQYIVTRVEEEHLWECKQLGAHSPHVLLSTLMFFNTKHFNLVSAEEHMQLSFSHIMKHWKRNQAAQAAAVANKTPGSRNILLRFYPPQSALAGNSKKKKVYEQQENEENPLRCPVKLYEFYLSKCPESVKTRNDVFYLLPERSCVPDSPVWYSTSPLAKENLVKMLNRVKIVKEINVSLLSS